MRRIFLILAAFVLLISCNSTHQLCDYVNPLVGTAWNGHTYPGAFVPNGLVSPSPDTHDCGWEHCAGYKYEDTTIMGFSQTHLSGTGAADMGDIRIAPITGEPIYEPGLQDAPETGFRSRFNHGTEISRPGYYAVTLDDYGIRCEMSATERCPIYRITFPEGKRAGIIVDLKHGVGDIPASWTLDEVDNALKGSRRSRGFIGDHTYYFYAEFSKSPLGYEFNEDGSEVYVEFPEASEVVVRMGVSTVSTEGALKNLRAEVNHWNLEKVEKQARAKWNSALSRVKIAKALGEDDKAVFYTALYHSLVAPIVINDVDGSFYGFDGEVHHSDSSMYTTFSLWDTYRAEHPFMNIAYQDMNVEYINAMLEIYRERGQLPIHVFGIWEVYGMIGFHSLPVLADAIMQDIGGFDWELAYEAMSKMALDYSYRFASGLEPLQKMGYIPAESENQSVSKLLEYCYNEWCVARVAEKLGKNEDAELFYELSGCYKNVFDEDLGFMRGKDSMGNWVEPFDPYKTGNSYYTEGNAWQYNFYVPQDITTYIDMMGGDEEFTAKLDEMFTTELDEDKRTTLDVTGLIGQYAQGNEPSHHAAYLYNYAGKPWKTQETVAQIKRQLYTSAPDGLCGNEDYGQMSAWYIMSAIGFYPVTPGANYYVIGTPTFPEISIDLINGKTFTVKAVNLTEENIYIQSATLNGQPYSKSYIMTEDVQKGGTLAFEMGPEPNLEWGSKQEDRPVIKL
ncbi:MAG: GH92 family glycosyl hydrolase [Bacteroidales bacterium]|nr:GH92 family glycosyl hydrolase [Bacteroidales bacterium]